MLKDYQEKLGFKVLTDNHKLYLCHNNTAIEPGLPIEGIMSAKPFQDKADEYIRKVVNSGTYRGR